MFESHVYSSEPIIDETNVDQWCPKSDVEIDGKVFSRGRVVPENPVRKAGPHLIEYTGPVYSREVIREKIKEREQHQHNPSIYIRRKEIDASNQNGLNYCWTYGVVSAINGMRVWRGMPYVEFSRESVAAPLKNYRNSGGWGDDALQRIVNVGIMPQDLWPQHYYRDDRYNTPENLAIAAKYKVTEFLVLPDNNFLAQASALVDDYIAGVGYNWWGHEVCALEVVAIGAKDLGFRIWNSWSNSYGDKGMAILHESKAVADDAVCPIVQMGE